MPPVDTRWLRRFEARWLVVREVIPAVGRPAPARPWSSPCSSAGGLHGTSPTFRVSTRRGSRSRRSGHPAAVIRGAGCTCSNTSRTPTIVMVPRRCSRRDLPPRSGPGVDGCAPGGRRGVRVQRTADPECPVDRLDVAARALEPRASVTSRSSSSTLLDILRRSATPAPDGTGAWTNVTAGLFAHALRPTSSVRGRSSCSCRDGSPVLPDGRLGAGSHTVLVKRADPPASTGSSTSRGVACGVDGRRPGSCRVGMDASSWTRAVRRPHAGRPSRGEHAGRHRSLVACTSRSGWPIALHLARSWMRPSLDASSHVLCDAALRPRTASTAPLLLPCASLSERPPYALGESAGGRVGFPLAQHGSHAGWMTDSPIPAALDDQLSMQLLHQRIIVLGAEVDDPIANRITAQLLLLSARDPRSDISLYVNSPGGSVTAGLAIYDTMRVIPNDVSTLAVGFAASMGQFLLGAGTPGQALRPAQRADHDAPAVRRHPGHRGRRRGPGREPQGGQAPGQRAAGASTRARPSSRSPTTASVTAGSVRRRRRHTASSTTSSAR